MKQTYVIDRLLRAENMRFAFVCGEWYAEAIDRMVDAARDVLLGAGVAEVDLSRYTVPGSFEIPVFCRHLCDKGGVDALLAFGVILRGETAHFDQMVGSIPQALVNLSVMTGIPIINEIIAADKKEQVDVRTQGASNKGYEAALAAIKIVTSLRTLK